MEGEFTCALSSELFFFLVRGVTVSLLESEEYSPNESLAVVAWEIISKKFGLITDSRIKYQSSVNNSEINLCIE
jgi:hypothetical protein